MSSREKEGVKYWRLVWLVAGLGAILRLWQYMINRSLWIDEAAIALNVLSRSFKGFSGPLDYSQLSPIGFLSIEKVAVILFGINEYALRLWPLVAGLLALALFPLVARRCCGFRATLAAVVFFTVSDRMIYYSSEVKPYSLDVAFTLAIFLLVLSIKQDGFTKFKMLVLSAVGVVAVWLSYTALFTLPIAAIVTGLLIYERKGREIFGWFIAVCIAWLVSIALCYWLSLPQFAVIPYQVSVSQFALAPFPFSSLIDFAWYFKILPALMENPGGFAFRGLALFAALIGVMSMLREKKFKTLILLLGPVFFAFAASGLNRYPIHGRFMLFAVPSALILVAEGIDTFMRDPGRLVKTGGVVLICLLILSPLWVSLKSFYRPRSGPCGPAETRSVIEYLNVRREPEDVIYAHHGAKLASKYYLYGRDISIIEGIPSWESSREYIDKIENLRGERRVWFLFASSHSWLGIDEERFFTDYLNQIGELKDSYKSPGSSAYLYDLGRH